MSGELGESRTGRLVCCPCALGGRAWWLWMPLCVDVALDEDEGDGGDGKDGLRLYNFSRGDALRTPASSASSPVHHASFGIS